MQALLGGHDFVLLTLFRSRPELVPPLSAGRIPTLLRHNRSMHSECLEELHTCPKNLHSVISYPRSSQKSLYPCKVPASLTRDHHSPSESGIRRWTGAPEFLHHLLQVPLHDCKGDLKETNLFASDCAAVFASKFKLSVPRMVDMLAVSDSASPVEDLPSERLRFFDATAIAAGHGDSGGVVRCCEECVRGFQYCVWAC